MENSEKELEESWHNNPKNWKWGVFYFNKDDKRIFTAKRNPEYGITLNFANRKSFIVIVLFFMFVGFIIYMINKNQ